MNNLLISGFYTTFKADCVALKTYFSGTNSTHSAASSQSAQNEKISNVSAAAIRMTATAIMTIFAIKTVTALHLTASAFGVIKVAVNVFLCIAARDCFVIARTTEDLVNKGEKSSVYTTLTAIGKNFFGGNYKESLAMVKDAANIYTKIKLKRYNQIQPSELEVFSKVIVMNSYFKDFWQDVITNSIRQISAH